MADIFIAPKKEKQAEKQNSKAMPEKPRIHTLSSFSHNPFGVSFQTQKERETIILFLRAHFITNLSWIFITLVLVILPIIILNVISSFGIEFLSTRQASNFTIVFVLFYYLLVFSYVFASFLHWFYNVFIVTSERVVDIDYSDIVVHNIAIASLSHVQDVNYSQSGFISTFFDYGDLFVQTAGDERNFEAYSIPKPREATHIIGDLTGKK
jgi:membrane protein YdbS with pleckstrin-like domain